MGIRKSLTTVTFHRRRSLASLVAKTSVPDDVGWERRFLGKVGRQRVAVAPQDLNVTRRALNWAGEGSRGLGLLPFFKGLGRGVEEEQFEVKHIAAAGVENVHPADGLPPLSTVDVVRSVRYLVCPVVRGRLWLTSSNDEFLIVLTVHELVKGGVNRLAQVTV